MYLFISFYNKYKFIYISLKKIFYHKFNIVVSYFILIKVSYNNVNNQFYDVNITKGP